MNKLLPIVLALLFFGLLFSTEAITDYHPNGMPKIIKTFKGSTKLELTKEVSYYSNGFKEYELTYYKGKVKNTQRWNENGEKIKDKKNSPFYIHIKFDDILNLTKGNDVIYSGLIIGEVKEVGKIGGLNSSEISPIVTLSIKNEYKDILYKDMVFTIKSSLYIENYWVEVSRDIPRTRDKIINGEVLEGKELALLENYKIETIYRSPEDVVEQKLNRAAIPEPIDDDTDDEEIEVFEDTDFNKFDEFDEDRQTSKFIAFDEAPVAISGVKMKYPAMAKAAGIEGKVVVEFFIDKNGKVTEVEIVTGTGTVLDQAAVEAVKKSTWKPARQRTKKVGVWKKLPFKFSLDK